MNRKKKTVVLIALLAVAAIVIVLLKTRNGNETGKIARIITPRHGTMRSVISTTGTVQPQNRVEIKPEIGGRIESVLVNEGQFVRKGRILAWMSSTDRAALIDAARAQGENAVKYWEETYKPIPIVAPITGTVIARSVEPGQSVTNAVAILVLSDRLIVKADVDETDIGRVKQGQAVLIRLDAYPEVEVPGRVGLISYESKIVNNVTMYEVDIIPATVPAVFRSGMSADLEIVDKTKERALLLPLDAVVGDGAGSSVWVVQKPDLPPVKRIVRTGMADDRNIEILSGVAPKDRIAVMEKKSIKLEKKEGKSPFMPSGRRPR